MTIKHLFPPAWPTVNFDFANTKALDPRITHTRDSIGTYFDENGILQYAAENEPRFDHDGATGESLGLLIEESRTNTLTHSAEFDNASWSVDGSLITADVQTSPDGTLTADKLVEDASSGNHIVYDTTPVITANPSFSCFAKAAERNFINLRLIRSGEADRVYATFDLTDGSVTDQGTIRTFFTGVQVQSESVGNSWYRLSISASSSSSTIRVSIDLSDAAVPTRTSNGGAPTYTGDGTSGVYIWGAQYEQGAFPTSYIPTNGAAVDRSADLVTADLTGDVPDEYTIITKPFGCASGKEDLSIYGYPHVQDVKIYPLYIPQNQINTVAKKSDEFWRWRVVGSSFALPNFITDGQVTVDWGDGTVEVLTQGTHTFTNGGGYHEVGFRLDSGTYFEPKINNDATIKDNVMSTGPAPESMVLSSGSSFVGCLNLTAVDGTFIVISMGAMYSSCTSLKSMPWIDTSSVTAFNKTWNHCSSLTSFPLLDTSSGTTFKEAWKSCSSLTSFPLIDTSLGENFQFTWQGCTGLTGTFPLIDTSSATTLKSTWEGCNNLTSFPQINTSLVGSFNKTWYNCSQLTGTFPLIDTSSANILQSTWGGCAELTGAFPSIVTSSVTNFKSCWGGCSKLTDFPAIDTSSGTDFQYAWNGCSSLTSFPLIDTSLGENFEGTWSGCSNIDNKATLGEPYSFPLIDTSESTTFKYAWSGCSSFTEFPPLITSKSTTFENCWRFCSGMTTFPAGFFDNWAPQSPILSGCFYLAWDGCTGLTPASVSNILDSLAVAGVAAPTGTGANYKHITITWDGTGDPATASAAAITTLKALNWEIYLNNVLQ